MQKTKMSIATDILIEQMQRINNLSQDVKDPENRKLFKEAITTSKTLNGSASNIIKEAATCLAIEKYSKFLKQDINTVIDRLGINYDEK